MLKLVEREVDLEVAAAMFMFHAKERIAAEKQYQYNFEGAHNLNLVELDQEISEIEGKAAELRKQHGFDF